MGCNQDPDSTKPGSEQAALAAPAGALNPGIKEDDVDQTAISAHQDGWSIIQEAVTRILQPNSFKNVGRLKGILLRIDSFYDETHAYTADDVANQSTQSMKDATKYKLKTYKIRIPELHVGLPIPSSVSNPTENDKRIIDMYPTVQAVNREAHNAPVRPSDLVWVQLQNAAALSGLMYLGPVDGQGTIHVKESGRKSPLPQGRCLEDCVKKYPSRGARGDSINNFGNLSKPSSGVSPLVSGEGISENRIIPGIIHKKWLVDRFRELQNSGQYRGLLWLGVCKNNGPEDNLAMLSDDGKRATYGLSGEGGKPGRSTVIYMPMGTDPTSEIEIIYWFHGGLGFKNGTKEWKRLWTSSLKEMSKKKKISGGARRNFILVIPEMPWSSQGSDAVGVPRRQTQITSGSRGSVAATTYQDRQWGAWGFDGAPINAEGQPDASKTPYSFKPLAEPLPPGVAGNIVDLHEEVLDILEDHFNLTNRDNVKYLTLAAEYKGGAAISNLARMGVLKDLKPTKIVLVHSDYSAVGPSIRLPSAASFLPTLGAPNAGIEIVQNRSHDNDLYEIIKNVDQTSPPQIEVHVSWDKQNSQLPREAFAAFLGATSVAKIGNAPSFASAVQKMKDFYKGWMHTIYGSGVTGYGKDGAIYYKDSGLGDVGNQHFLRTATIDGYTYISNKQKSTIKLPGGFNNITYKGWSHGGIQGALGWVAPEKSPQSVVKEVTLAKTENTLLGDPNVPNSVKNVFRDFDGKVILYSSDLVGPSKNVAILKPNGAAPYVETDQYKNMGLPVIKIPYPYELVYYLHGDIGLNGAAKTYTDALENQIKAMVSQNRNVIIVLMDIDPYPFSALSNLWEDGAFNDFHKEVQQKIVKHFWETQIGESTGWFKTLMDAMGDPKPQFFSIKAFGGGSRILKNIIKTLDDEHVGPKKTAAGGGLTRIDLLDANWGMEGPILSTLNTAKWKSKITLGGNFEVQVIAGPKTFGDQHISVKERIEVLQDREGVWATAVDTPYNSFPYTYFSAKNKLPNNTISLPPLLNSDGPTTYLDLIFNKYGQAYSNGERMPEYDLKIAKGVLKNHIPSTEQVGHTAACKTNCLQTHVGPTITPSTPGTIAPFFAMAIQDCNKNPLGLIKYETSQFKSIIINPVRTSFSWGTKKMGEYLKGIDDPLWLDTKNETRLVIKDLSPEKANGIDKVQGHKSHREGIDVGLNLPQIGVSIPERKRIKSPDLDVDAMLVFMILSKIYDAKVIFLDQKFFRAIEDRAMFIANDGPGVFKADSAYKLFFKKHLFGKPNFAKSLMQLLQHKRGYEDRLQVRIIRKWASHETKDYPKWALQRLKKLGCNYQGAAAI